MTTREYLVKGMDEMGECLNRTAGRVDIWQDRIIHTMCRWLYFLMEREIKRIDKEASSDVGNSDRR